MPRLGQVFPILWRLSLLALGLVPWLASPTRAEEIGDTTHVYAMGIILPDVPAPERDKALTDFYHAWKATYLTEGCGDGRAYVKIDAKGETPEGGSASGTITVSEAQGYGMLATVLMDGMDPDAHRLFDALVRFFQDHPADSGPGLMAWNQVAGCANAAGHVDGGTSASDGDLDIAFALLLADRTWGSAGAIDYAALARQTLTAILDREVAAEDRFILLGDWAKSPDDEEPDYAITTRVSDFMPAHFTTFGEVTKDPRWFDIRDQTYTLLEKTRQRWARNTGLVPDFVIDHLDGPSPAPRGFLEGPDDGAFSWNAARYPWRVAMDAILHGNQRARAALLPMITWIRQDTDDKPERINAGYGLSGIPVPDQGEGAMAFVAPQAVAAMVDPAHQGWLNSLWTAITARPLAQEDYYGNTLKLLCMIALTGHWTTP